MSTNSLVNILIVICFVKCIDYDQLPFAFHKINSGHMVNLNWAVSTVELFNLIVQCNAGSAVT